MKRAILLLSTVLVLSISYYFVIALPANQRARLEFDRQKYRDEQMEKTDEKLRADFKAQVYEKSLLDCLTQAKKAADDKLQLNGTPVDGHPGAYSAPEYVMNAIQRELSTATQECHRLYGQ
jgi:hypothetical protein